MWGIEIQIIIFSRCLATTGTKITMSRPVLARFLQYNTPLDRTGAHRLHCSTGPKPLTKLSQPTLELERSIAPSGPKITTFRPDFALFEVRIYEAHRPVSDKSKL